MLGLLNPMEGFLSISDTNINDDIEVIEENYHIPEAPVIMKNLH